MKEYKGKIFVNTPKFRKEAGFIATEKSSRLMSKIRGGNTKVEVRLRKGLWKAGYRYRLHSKKVIGKPDIILFKFRIVIFVDGDFWHGYDWEQKKKKLFSNKAYWIAKIESNIERDKKVTKSLADEGWEVLRFWEHEIEEDLDKCVKRILATIKNK